MDTPLASKDTFCYLAFSRSTAWTFPEALAEMWPDTLLTPPTIIRFRARIKPGSSTLGMTQSLRPPSHGCL